MAENVIEINAKKIWDALDKNFALTIDELRSITKLADNDLIPALHWMFDVNEVFFITINNETKICLTENE